MSIFGRIRDYFIKALSLTEEKAWNPHLWNLYGSQSLAGEYVDESSALTYSAVYNAVSLIAGTIGSLPLHLMQRKGKAKRIAEDYKLYRVMHDEWNPYITAMAGREAMMAHVLLWGNGYAEIVRNAYGEIVQLWPITPDRIVPEMDDGEMVYGITVDGRKIYLPRSKVLHVPGLGFDGFTGYSVVNLARKSLGLGMALETFGSLYFGQGTHPGIVVKHPMKLSAQGHSNLEGSLVKEYSGLGKSHRLLLLEEGMTIEKLGIPPEDSQFLESRQFQIPEVARWFNLPPHKVKDLTKSSFNNIESEQISFVTDSILPWLVRLEQNYNMQLLSQGDKEWSGRGRLYFKHIVEGLLRGDSESRGSYYSQMFNIGAMSINEIREKEDMDPIDGGDKHFVPLNMTTVEDAGREIKFPPPKQTPALPPGNGEDKDEEIDARRRSQ